ncbi:ROK family protein [Paenibacillus pasadenensis]|uniref:ROK family protein n=1 Tax=Paenibacillus pasadenensis TaxID=217090 RepID=UPI002041993B|nr:ROK family protein [Paenibacillus pasadenensis]MCM3749970.1 ROK family protein [Paenibacillus pasadenensis]
MGIAKKNLPTIGIDIGGTGIKGIALDTDGVIYAKLSVPTEASRGREAVLLSVEELVGELLERCPTACALGIASAGRINALSGEVVYATDNLPGWTGLRLAEWAGLRFGLPVAVDNDANAALFGEWRLGAAQGLSSAVMLTLGTGVGGANMESGRLLHGAGWSGGEWGHAVLVPGGLPCNCGRRGCAEQYLSGAALMRSAEAAFERASLSPAELLQAFSTGEARAAETLREYTSLLAVFAANLKAGFDPEAILLGGGAAASLEIWRPLLEQALAAEGAAGLRVLQAQLGNQAGCIGAAFMAADLAQAITGNKEEESA